MLSSAERKHAWLLVLEILGVRMTASAALGWSPAALANGPRTAVQGTV